MCCVLVRATKMTTWLIIIYVIIIKLTRNLASRPFICTTHAYFGKFTWDCLAPADQAKGL